MNLFSLCTSCSLPDLDANTVAFQLQLHKFPAAKWNQLATGLKQATAVPNIDSSMGDVHSKLQALIIHWVDNDQEKSWQKLIQAVAMSGQVTTAQELASSIGVSYQCSEYDKPPLPRTWLEVRSNISACKIKCNFCGMITIPACFRLPD